MPNPSLVRHAQEAQRIIAAEKEALDRQKKIDAALHRFFERLKKINYAHNDRVVAELLRRIIALSTIADIGSEEFRIVAKRSRDLDSSQLFAVCQVLGLDPVFLAQDYKTKKEITVFEGHEPVTSALDSIALVNYCKSVQNKNGGLYPKPFHWEGGYIDRDNKPHFDETLLDGHCGAHAVGNRVADCLEQDELFAEKIMSRRDSLAIDARRQVLSQLFSQVMQVLTLSQLYSQLRNVTQSLMEVVPNDDYLTQIASEFNQSAFPIDKFPLSELAEKIKARASVDEVLYEKLLEKLAGIFKPLTASSLTNLFAVHSASPLAAGSDADIEQVVRAC